MDYKTEKIPAAQLIDELHGGKFDQNSYNLDCMELVSVVNAL